MIDMNEPMKEALLDIHNKLRNDIALGNVANYEAAVNMSIMSWDDELAYLCKLNIASCAMIHDSCRNTGECSHNFS